MKKNKFVGGLSEIGTSLVRGDVFVKLSLILMGTGYFRRKQYIKGLFVTLYQAAVLFYISVIGFPYLEKISTLGTVKRQMQFNLKTMKNEMNDYDHSFKILLFGIITILVILAFIASYVCNIIKVYHLQRMAEQGKHIQTFREDIRSYLDQKFHVTLLFFPMLGVVLFTVIPLIVMISVAFTSYDQNHLPPTSLFTWVGVKNFKALFSNSLSSSFGYAFGKVLCWTLVWAFFATFTTFVGGVLLAMFINNRNTKCKKLWRTLFIIAIAVPQFVTLLLVRNFFADLGIVNSICSHMGITDFLKSVGLVKNSLDHIPFLTDPNWARVMIILINIWVGVPYLMLIATGVLMNIPAELMEAAKIDGANGLQIFKSITMPYMLFVTGPYLITSFVQNINNFNVIYLLTQDVFVTHNQLLANSQAKEVDLLVTWLYRLTQDYYNYKMASVIGIAVFVVCAGFTLLAFNFMIKGNREEEFQ